MNLTRPSTRVMPLPVRAKGVAFGAGVVVLVPSAAGGCEEITVGGGVIACLTTVDVCLGADAAHKVETCIGDGGGVGLPGINHLPDHPPGGYHRLQLRCVVVETAAGDIGDIMEDIDG